MVVDEIIIFSIKGIKYILWCGGCGYLCTPQVKKIGKVLTVLGVDKEENRVKIFGLNGDREREKILLKSKDIFGGVKKALIFALPNKNGVSKKLFTASQIPFIRRQTAGSKVKRKETSFQGVVFTKKYRF